MSLSKRQKQYLISGYIRSNSNRNDPIIISEQCYLFYEETFEWKLGAEILNQFLNANHTEPFEFPQIKYHDITFICIAYPNGIKRDDEGYISLVIKMLSKPKDIEEIVTSCHVYLQNKLMYKEHITFNSNCSQFLLGNSSLCDSKLSEYRDVNSLVFGIDIQIVGVNYHEQGERFDNGKWTDYLVYSQPIPLPQYIKYEWKLDDLILREMRKDSNRIFYYENGTNWTMLLYTNYCKPTFMVYLTKLPGFIKTINIRLKLTLKCDNKDEDMIVIHDVMGLNLSRKIIAPFLHYIESMNACTFMCEIFILKTFDKNGNTLFNDDQQQSRFVNEFRNC